MSGYLVDRSLTRNGCRELKRSLNRLWRERKRERGRKHDHCGVSFLNDS